MSEPPSEVKLELKDLVVAVKEITDWYGLGLQLCLPVHILKKIRSNPDIDSRMSDMLYEWLQYDPEASWEKLAAALEIIDKNVVADNIRARYMGVSTRQAVEQSRHHEKKRKAMTETAVRKIKARFSKLLIEVQSALETHQVDVKKIRRFLIHLFESECKIPNVSDLGEIFEDVTFSKLWRFDNYGPLQELSENFLPEEDSARTQVTEYVSHLSAFYATTSLFDCMELAELEEGEEDDNPFSPKKYNRFYKKISITLKLARDMSELTLKFLDQLWKSLRKEFNLVPLTAVLDRITQGSLCITWLVLPNVLRKIRAMFFKSLQFLQLNGIVKISLYDDDLTIYDASWMENSTLLYRACFSGNVEQVNTLLVGGVNVNEHNDNDGGDTPLMGVCRNGHVDIVKTLLIRGALVDVQNKYGQSALMVASVYGQSAVVSVLVEYGATVDLQDDGGWTALIYACRCGHTDIGRMLLDHGAVIDHCDKDGHSALMQASAGGHTETVEMLLERGATVDLPDNDERTALMYACFYGHTDIGRMLLDHGAVIDHCEKEYGSSALMQVSAFGYTETVEMLLERGATVDLPNNGGMTALTYASGNGQASTARILLHYGAAVGHKDNDGVAPLWYASREGHHETVNVLLEFGAEVDLPTDDEYGNTALSVACQEGHAETVRMLLEKGANIDYQDKKGQSALVLACVGGHDETVKVLLEKKAKVDLQNDDGWTALFFAAREDKIEAVKMLLEYGATVHIRSKTGLTAFDVAKTQSHQAVCELLAPYITGQSSKVSPDESGSQRETASDSQQQETKSELTEEQRAEVRSVGKRIWLQLEKIFLRDLVKKREESSQPGVREGMSRHIMEPPKQRRSNIFGRLWPALGRRRRIQLVGTAPAAEH